MKVLMINKFLYPKGGAETYTLALGKMLQIHGHDVQYFGLNNKKNTVGNPLFHSDSNDIFDADVFHGQFESSISGALDCFFVYNFCLSDLCGIYGLYIAGASDRARN